MEGNFGEFRWENKSLEVESLHINKNKGNVRGALTALKFTDKDTKQIVFYIPSIEISGYGEDDEQALEMLKFSMHEFYKHLIAKSGNEIQAELFKLGWKKDAFRSKNFSKSYVDENGCLQNLNAVDNKVERLALAI